MDQTSGIRLLRQGDPLAWEAFVRAHQGRVFGIAYHYTGQAEDARDLAQEVFVRVYRHLDRVPDDLGVVPWLVALTRNACIDFLRRRQARPPAWDLPAESLLGLAAPEPDPEAAHLAEARRLGLHRALQQLTDLNREMILLKEIQGLALEEIARMLDIPVGTVMSRANRARLELAEKLTALGWGG